jgi:hypothetical protein
MRHVPCDLSTSWQKKRNITARGKAPWEIGSAQISQAAKPADGGSGMKIIRDAVCGGGKEKASASARFSQPQREIHSSIRARALHPGCDCTRRRLRARTRHPRWWPAVFTNRRTRVAHRSGPENSRAARSVASAGTWRQVESCSDDGDRGVVVAAAAATSPLTLRSL